ncbi:cytochrome c oxidase assembly protein [Azoarcus sp. PA01]|nr:cytochrome c oxidase assembly protein [Azoarcus sp. PA01]
MRLTAASVLVMLLVTAPPAAAHALSGSLPAGFALLLTAGLLGAACGLYAVGARRVLPGRAQATWFCAAMAIGALAVVGPLDRWAQDSTAVHMVQHMLLIVVVAPLGALASPLPQWSAATGALLRPLWATILRCGRHPLAAAMVHGVLIWIWHAPRMYRLALDDPWWHLIEHVSFVASGWLFWWSVLCGRRLAPALLAILLTLIHTGLLGALLTFGRVSFYGDARALEDQQLAGLIMWVPGGFAYLAAAGWIVWRRLGEEAVPAAVPARD